MRSVIHLTRLSALSLLMTLGSLVAWSQTPTTVALGARHDVTLIEHDGGALGDGRGPGLRAGRTSQGAGSVRRAAIAFNVTGEVPRDARIVSATLILSMSGNNEEPSIVSLHRALDEWGEGGSSSSGGGGASAAPGDTTWMHRFHNPAAPRDSPAWNRPGGDFRRPPRATARVDGAGYYSWNSPRLVEDVQLWLDRPFKNHGWIVLGDETSPGSAKRFDSRESADESVRPVLLIEFIPLDPLGSESGDDENSD